MRTCVHGPVRAHGRRRWIFGEAKLWGKHVWFRAHIACQLLGFAAFIAGIVLGFTLDYEVRSSAAARTRSEAIGCMGGVGQGTASDLHATQMGRRGRASFNLTRLVPQAFVPCIQT